MYHKIWVYYGNVNISFIIFIYLFFDKGNVNIFMPKQC